MDQRESRAVRHVKKADGVVPVDDQAVSSRVQHDVIRNRDRVGERNRAVTSKRHRATAVQCRLQAGPITVRHRARGIRQTRKEKRECQRELATIPNQGSLLFQVVKINPTSGWALWGVCPM